MYKVTYTKEEVDELLNWFDTHSYDNAVDLGQGIMVDDVSKVIAMNRLVVSAKYANSSYSGLICILFRMREALIAQGKVK